MSTRGAAKREAAFLQAAMAAKTLSSPPSTPTEEGVKQEAGVVVTIYIEDKTLAGTDENATGNLSSSKTTVSLAGAKRKRVPTKGRKARESVKGEWDILPHGLGREGDLLGDTIVNHEEPEDGKPAPLRRRSQRGKASGENNVVPTMGGNPMAKVGLTSAELLEGMFSEGHQEEDSIKTKEDGARAEDEHIIEERPKKRRATPAKKGHSVSEDVISAANNLVLAPEDLPKKRRKKANKYGLTPGESPFPSHVKPTVEDCEEVNRLLSILHGEVKPPEVIPPPSMEVTGCGEVPDLLDAILRTLLSASTTANNANLSLQGLKDKFGLRESGVGKGSISWEAVQEASLDAVIDAIKSGGLAKVKGTNIKKILAAVYQQNHSRREALLEERRNGKPADIPGAQNMTPEQKDIEITRINENMLSMDYIFEVSTDEAMEEMTKLPGIGVKTASCVILFCMKRPSFAVDTHVWRHCKWLGWVPEKATRDQTFSHCEVRVPDHLKYSLHQLFLKHGKTCGRCRANTSSGTEEWDNTDCPIDHLVSRMEKKKMLGHKPVGKSKSGNKGKKGKKGKKGDDETDDSDTFMGDDADTDADGFEDDV